MREMTGMTADRLMKCFQLLDTLSTSTEEDFLNVASRLKEIRDRASKISKLAASVVGFVSGSVMVEAITELNVLTDKVSTCLNESSLRLKTSVDNLQNIADSITEVNEHIEDMNRLIRNLYKLGFFTKIENSSLRKAERGLESLSEDVRLLSESIIRKTRSISEGSGTLIRAISSSLLNIKAIGERQRTETSEVIKTTLASIAALKEKYHHSAELASEISSTSDEMSRSIWEIVSSVQFHDITRQQLEQSKRMLESALRGIDGTSTGSETSGRGDGTEARLGGVYRFCVSEPVQLRNARTELVTAAKSVVRNLNSISEKMREMLDGTRKITGSDIASGSFLIEIEDVLSAVTATTSVLAGDTTVMKELSEVITLTVSIARDLIGFTGEIEEIGDDVGLLAINAAVTAQRIGDEGRPFNVIADSISHISSEARVHTEAISRTLRVISTLAEGLWNDTAACGEDELTDTSADLERLIASLHSVNREMAEAFSNIEELEKSLSQEIEDIISGTNIHVRVDKAIEEILAILAETASKLRTGEFGAAISGFIAGDDKGTLKQAGDGQVPSYRLASAGPGEFGENVDLF